MGCIAVGSASKHGGDDSVAAVPRPSVCKPGQARPGQLPAPSVNKLSQPRPGLVAAGSAAVSNSVAVETPINDSEKYMRSLKVSDSIDCLDSNNRWDVGVVQEVVRDGIIVHTQTSTSALKVTFAEHLRCTKAGIHVVPKSGAYCDNNNS